MRLTHHADLAMRVLMHLALSGERRLTIREISDAFGISRNHLMKVAHKLAGLGYIESTRGSGGGIRLGRPPESINIGHVVRDMEPDFGLVECFRPENRCIITPACILPRMLDEALRAFLAVLDQYTLADLVTPKAGPEMARILRIRID
ncbi:MULTISPECIES: Rrf2 family transcriptional regulator [unclassified Wenzhouxiangella]|uniref:RrF2 family transcriptional regulator n=1 Tax=unclassified Wenzhouxiangella TaxID=2613841 RepID=UPI000E3267E4|nr:MULTISPECIES: Rrf2 family transcriptional regulator [unclassified Wenzhouxiangella]RFF27246.1 Rrf2 family transcriptional regulator [Wenzhouxiangella sp. 15181]RFP69226.1 Rrf2 family transcriptional regulator [Wenzhouxiangella sp. 15190]